jgi:hypothetical protein
VGWTFFWLMVVLKIPIIAAIWIVWWAVHAVPEPLVEGDGHEDDGGSHVPPEHRSRPKRPKRPRGPHGEPQPPSPARVRRRVLARSRTPRV